MARVLVVDDSIVFRNLISAILEKVDGIEVCAMAANGREAVRLAEEMKPDLITLDVEMPVMGGLEALREIKKQNSAIEIILVSALTRQGADITMQGFESGAFDFITKPEGAHISASVAELRDQLIPKIRSWLDGRTETHAEPAAPKVLHEVHEAAVPRHTAVLQKIDLVAIGISTGGPRALAQMIPGLAADFPVPIGIVQHMPPVFTKALAESLSRVSPLKIFEAEEGMKFEAGKILIAPGGKHMKIENRSGEGLTARLSDEPPENFCRPSVDTFFRSVSTQLGGRVLALIMTGMGSDGLLGAKLLKRQGAQIFAQDKESSVVFGMPGEVVKSGIADRILPLAQIAGALNETVRKSRR